MKLITIKRKGINYKMYDFGTPFRQQLIQDSRDQAPEFLRRLLKTESKRLIKEMGDLYVCHPSHAPTIKQGNVSVFNKIKAEHEAESLIGKLTLVNDVARESLHNARAN